MCGGIVNFDDSNLQCSTKNRTFELEEIVTNMYLDRLNIVNFKNVADATIISNNTRHGKHKNPPQARLARGGFPYSTVNSVHSI